MKLPFVTRARFENAKENSSFWWNKYFNACRDIATLNAEIADRIISETDAREQLRALKATIQPRQKNGRFAAKVAG